ncbi:uncharacterized protein VTP21DRAFT_6084 [Calcarisporiella thermophila]|uniref:uncharacterized protein n=1 Tax=Calcarisporiella thermophila TaxID=911321 RepID=UPI003742672C
MRFKTISLVLFSLSLLAEVKGVPSSQQPPNSHNANVDVENDRRLVDSSKKPETQHQHAPIPVTLNLTIDHASKTHQSIPNNTAVSDNSTLNGDNSRDNITALHSQINYKEIKDEADALHQSIIIFSSVAGVIIVACIILGSVLYYRRHRRRKLKGKKRALSDPDNSPDSDREALCESTSSVAPQSSINPGSPRLSQDGNRALHAWVRQSATAEDPRMISPAPRPRMLRDVIPLQSLRSLSFISPSAPSAKELEVFEYGQSSTTSMEAPYITEEPPAYTPSAPPLYELARSGSLNNRISNDIVGSRL